MELIKVTYENFTFIAKINDFIIWKYTPDEITNTEWELLIGAMNDKKLLRVGTNTNYIEIYKGVVTFLDKSNQMWAPAENCRDAFFLASCEFLENFNVNTTFDAFMKGYESSNELSFTKDE